VVINLVMHFKLFKMSNTMIFFLSLIGCSLLPGCTDNNSAKRDNKKQKDSTPAGPVLEKIQDFKPKFPGFTPRSYVIGQDTTFVIVISNSKYLQKAWMVYYDKDDRKWATLTWIGSGDNDTIIGDTVFYRKNGIGKGSDTGDAPEFYFAFSGDNGKTWKPHQIYEGVIKCKQADKQTQKENQILVSGEFLNADKPSVGLILQHHYPSIISTDSITAKHNFDFYCDLARQLSFSKKAPSDPTRHHHK
jgi:hypothetical protein